MFGKSKIIFATLAIAGAALMAQPAFADGKGMTIGVGSNVRHGRPGGGTTGFRPSVSQSPFVYGGFVPPSVVFQPSFVMPNYYLPGDFYSQSTFLVPASPVVVYNPPLSGGGFLFAPPGGGGQNRHSLTFGPLNR